MGDEQRPPRRPSITVIQSGNAEQLPYLTEPSSTGTTVSFVGDSRFRAPNEPLSSSRQGSAAKVAIPRVSSLSEQSSINKRLRDLTNQVQDYEQLLSDLQTKLDPEDTQLIQETLSRYNFEGDGSIADELSMPVTRPAPSELGPSDIDLTGTPPRPIVTGFLSGADYTEEDFNRNERSKSLGFMGKHSETSWLYQLKRELEFKFSEINSIETWTPEDQQDHNSIASVSYFLDDNELAVLEDAEPLARPQQAIANSLVQNFFTTVHPTFPIIVQDTFVRQLNTFYNSPFVRPGRRWLAVLNLVFATSSRCFNYQMQPNSLAANDDSLLYFSRAWKLSMTDHALLDHPDLQQVQIEGLTAIFLLASGHVNRAWRICGMAIRSATAMGLNLRSESNYVTLASKESRYKVWWSLYTLETILGNMTGRPLSVEKDFCTTPLPVPFEEHEYTDTNVIRMMSELKIRNTLLGHVVTRPIGELFVTLDEKSVRSAMETLKPNMALYFVCFVDLTRINREIVETLYAPEIVQNSSRDAGGAITDANAKLEAWLSKLPAGFRFIGKEQLATRERFNLCLALHFYSAKILACKPCLHYSDRPVAADDSFYDRIAASCVQSACRMLDLFPAEYDASWLNQVAPWWCILHYLVQATAVLLIDFPLNPATTAAAAGGVSAVEPRQALEKAASWLNEMALRDMASQRACAICASLLRKLSQVVVAGRGDEEAQFSEVGLYR
ncbi:hypothetical protein UA08_06121 [Talaromyces atroroseus]|uniref:Xylanolytic transcriptional activator regulatory domain-containing protein n=1 Tax=Talaromyces atroroseus TaxID=1441469 RepID=A0A225AC00_TALAT|nr:hypothetical protein UA08_06121 [Talaromyces atroroseus]OKL58631.1 hypothetical protein UA08_06121 [Talaromyces atroroseus]